MSGGGLQFAVLIKRTFQNDTTTPTSPAYILSFPFNVQEFKYQRQAHQSFMRLSSYLKEPTQLVSKKTPRQTHYKQST